MCYVFCVQIHHLKSQTSVECLLSHFKVSDSVQPCRRQPTRLPHLWDSPGKNTGVGCHFLLKCMKVKSQSEVVQSYPNLSDPWTAAYQAPLSMGFSRQEYWSGVPLPSSVPKTILNLSAPSPSPHTPAPTHHLPWVHFLH